MHLQEVNEQLAHLLDAINNLAQVLESGEALQTYITRRNQLLDVSLTLLPSPVLSEARFKPLKLLHPQHDGGLVALYVSNAQPAEKSC